MDSKAHIRFNAEDRSYFAILKRDIHQLATAAGFSSLKTGQIDIIVAEIASNLVKHAGGGEVLVRFMEEEEDNQAIEIISIDNGPGMADANRMVEDGMSTTNTLGQGLGSIKRLADTFEIYSMKNWGTILLCRVYKTEQPHFKKKPVAEVRSVIIALPGETLSGDGAHYSITPQQATLFLGDGLGHGPDAHAAVQQAIATLSPPSNDGPVDLLREMHAKVKKTRGLVGAAAVYNFKEKKWRICGIGNIATTMYTPNGSKGSLSHNGIIGMNIPTTLKEQEIAAERGQIIIMCSDGIKTRWDIQKYVNIFKYDLSVLAAAIYKDHSRKTDDMSVLVGRINA